MTIIIANSISPVMVRYVLMLFIGNAIIGVFEGLVIARIFKISHWKSIALMILANYASMWAGALLFGVAENPSPVPDNLFSEPLHHVQWMLWICMGMALLLSLIIEWPFCHAAMKAGPGRLKRSITASVVAQASSYACIGLAFMPSHNSLNKEVEIVRRLARIAELPNGEVFFVNPSDGDVYSITLTGGSPAHRFEAGLLHPDDVLTIAPATEDAAQRRLEAQSRSKPRAFDYIITGHAEPFWRYPDDSSEREVVTTAWWLGVIGIADLRAIGDRDWKARPRGNSGLRVENTQKEFSYAVAYDTIFTSWAERCVSILPGDFVVFEFGPQICLLDMRTRQISMLCRGRSPVVILEP